MYSTSDIIAAPATPVLKGPLTVIRVSGDHSWQLLDALFQSRHKSYQPWKALLGEWRDERGVIDEVIVLPFKAPYSYTGQDMFEITCHGNPVLVEAVLQSLYRSGVRLAKPGEFTSRAVLSGKMSLFHAENVQAIIDAKTRYHAELIRKQEENPLVPLLEQTVGDVLRVQAHIEACIDYGEEDIDALNVVALTDKLKAIEAQLKVILKNSVFPHKMREGFRILLTGDTNVGKSSLFNALCNHQRAIVTDIPGTTRDLVHEEVELEGFPVVFIDSAGVRETDDQVEQIGIDRIKGILHEMDIILYLTPSAEPQPLYSELQRVDPEKLLVVHTKSDLNNQGVIPGKLTVSIEDEASIAELKIEIVKRLKRDFGTQYLVTQRQENALDEALNWLASAIESLQQGFGEEICASHLNTFRRKIGELTGETTVEDILDQMFSDFCLGK
ncbi:MAG: tRNA uridine-5-carboxymethylaminomethyl(34) synthesis GTPase MnmE [Acidobacteria bacterium]|nr:MAG: tRNA uridine-5-carboxymethylaminomethyl(34) synthesis GTPase MnmE [Acidobacteriota bacterium]